MSEGVNMRVKTERPPNPAGQQVMVKKVPEPLTEAQFRDRREMLRQQTELLSKTAR
jgi:hypothetical protein